VINKNDAKILNKNPSFYCFPEPGLIAIIKKTGLSAGLYFKK